MNNCDLHVEQVRQQMLELYPDFPDLTPVCSRCCKGCNIHCYFQCKRIDECKTPTQKGKEDMPKKKTEEVEVSTTPASTTVDDNKLVIRRILFSTERDGVEDLIDQMERMGFFTAPASGGNHSHMEGGLAQHSLNVLGCAEKIGLALLGAEEYNKIHTSVVTCALLHDIGKCGDWEKSLYVENILKSGKRSEAKPWKRNPELTNIPHGVRSVLIIERYLFDLTEDEEYAIMYHDGLYEPSNVAVIRGHETPLYMILHWADMWASHCMEGGDEDAEE